MMPHVSIDGNSQVRITVWPPAPLQLPRYRRCANYRLDDSATLLIASPEWVEVTDRRGEMYLRLYGVDLADPESIVAFANRYGIFREPRMLHDQLERSRVLRRPYSVSVDQEKVEAFVRAEYRRGLKHHAWWVTGVEEFRYAARCIRDLTTAWRILNDGLEPDLSLLEELEVVPSRDPYLDARWLLATGLNALLARFQPLLMPGLDPEREPEFLWRLTAEVNGSRDARPALEPEAPSRPFVLARRPPSEGDLLDETLARAHAAAGGLDGG